MCSLSYSNKRIYIYIYIQHYKNADVGLPLCHCSICVRVSFYSTLSPQERHPIRSNVNRPESGPTPLDLYLNKMNTFIFILWLPIPVMSAYKSHLNFWLIQNLSKRFLNMLLDSAEARCQVDYSIL